MGAYKISSKKQLDGVVIVRLEGMLDIFAFPDLKKSFRGLIEHSKGPLVVVDMGAVEFIASSGWSVLLAARRIFNLNGGDLSIFGVNDGIRRVYDAMHIGKMLPIAKTLDEADILVRGYLPSPRQPEQGLADYR